jgi:hypothetical protein
VKQFFSIALLVCFFGGVSHADLLTETDMTTFIGTHRELLQEFAKKNNYHMGYAVVEFAKQRMVSKEFGEDLRIEGENRLYYGKVIMSALHGIGFGGISTTKVANDGERRSAYLALLAVGINLPPAMVTTDLSNNKILDTTYQNHMAECRRIKDLAFKENDFLEKINKIQDEKWDINTLKKIKDSYLFSCLIWDEGKRREWALALREKLINTKAAAEVIEGVRKIRESERLEFYNFLKNCPDTLCIFGCFFPMLNDFAKNALFDHDVGCDSYSVNENSLEDLKKLKITEYELNNQIDFLIRALNAIKDNTKLHLTPYDPTKPWAGALYRDMRAAQKSIIRGTKEPIAQGTGCLKTVTKENKIFSGTAAVFLKGDEEVLVITNAHCVLPREDGDPISSITLIFPGGKHIRLEEVYIHPLYNPDVTWGPNCYDVAILRGKFDKESFSEGLSFVPILEGPIPSSINKGCVVSYTEVSYVDEGSIRKLSDCSRALSIQGFKADHIQDSNIRIPRPIQRDGEEIDRKNFKLKPVSFTATDDELEAGLSKGCSGSLFLVEINGFYYIAGLFDSFSYSKISNVPNRINNFYLLSGCRDWTSDVVKGKVRPSCRLGHL